MKPHFPDRAYAPFITARTWPAHVGWYECVGFRFNGALHLFWNGLTWQYFGPKHSDPAFPSFGSHARDKWRGLAIPDHRMHKNTRHSDITGHRFGLLTAIREEFRTPHGLFWRFVCDCGRETVAMGKWVTSGNTASCGCQRGLPGIKGNKSGKGRPGIRMPGVSRPWNADRRGHPRPKLSAVGVPP